MYLFGQALKKSPMVSTGLIRNFDKRDILDVSKWKTDLWKQAFTLYSEINVYTKLPTETIGFTLFTLTKSTSAGHCQVMAFKCLFSPVDTKTQRHVIFKAFQRKKKILTS